MSEKPIDVLGDPEDYSAMPDLQLISLYGDGDLDAYLELYRRAHAAK